MGKQSKAKKPDNFGKGKVTPVQVAFIVDRYLSDNNYSQSRSIFRTEASDLISKSPVQEAPKSLLSLGAMLDEYICLKEQKVMVDQEKRRLEMEKCRVQTLFQGMQDAMNAYNVGGSTPMQMIPPAAAKSMVTIPQLDPSIGSPAGYPVYNTPIVMSGSMPSNGIMEPTNFSTPISNNPSIKKRRGLKTVPDAPLAAKKSRSQLPTKQLPIKGNDTLSQSNNAANIQENVQQFTAVQLSPHNHLTNGSLVQGSSVAKSLFNQPSLSPPNTSGPKTPPQAFSSQSDKSVSPLEISPSANSNNNNAPQEISTNCTVISSETVRVSPFKQMAYYMERNHCISSSSPVKTNSKRLSKRDHVKGRLDFDGSDVLISSEKPNSDGISTSESEREMEIFDMDLPNLDAFGADFSFSELLVDFDLDCEGFDSSCQPVLGSSLDSVSGSPNESGDGNFGANQVLAEFSSTVTEFLSEKDMNIQGSDSLTSVKSITKCIKILSPAKNHRSSSLDQENLSAAN